MPLASYTSEGPILDDNGLITAMPGAFNDCIINGDAPSESGMSVILGGTSGLTVGHGTSLYSSGGAASIRATGCGLLA